MDYTTSNAYITDADTGNRMHQDTAAVTTEVEARDINGPTWELLSIIKASGVAPVAFDKTVPASYTQVAAAIQSGMLFATTAGGAADAITAVFTPGITTLSMGMALYVRAASANATTTPTFTPASGTIAAKAIVKGNGLPLVPGDIAGAGHWIELQYDLTLDKWVLLNPATGVVATGRLLRIVVITASAPWNKGPGTKDAYVEVTGGGAPGGGAPATGSNQGSISGGGSGGATGRKFIRDVVSPQNVTIGAPGVPVVGGVGTNGGTTSFGSLVSATGGIAGGSSAATAGQVYVLGGGRSTASGGDINIPGGFGEDGWISTTPIQNGMAGKGGDTPLGFGGKGTLNSPGGDASGYGAGGGGVQNGAGVAAQPGGKPTGGVTIVWEYA